MTLFEMGAHPFLTLTLFIAMFERDHGPMEYQLAYGAAMKHLTLPTRTSRPDVRAALLQAYASAPVVGSRPSPEGETVVGVSVAPVVPLDLLCASGTSYLREPALPYVPGVQGVGQVVRSPTLEAGTRCGSRRTPGWSPGTAAWRRRAR